MSRQVYVGRLSSRIHRESLQQEFEKFGKIKDIDLRNTHAFIEFESTDDARVAVEKMDNKRLAEGSDRITVKPRDDRPQGARGPTSRDVCFNCGRKGHWANECKEGMLIWHLLQETQEIRATVALKRDMFARTVLDPEHHLIKERVVEIKKRGEEDHHLHPPSHQHLLDPEEDIDNSKNNQRGPIEDPLLLVVANQNPQFHHRVQASDHDLLSVLFINQQHQSQIYYIL